MQHNYLSRVFKSFSEIFNLRRDCDENGTIENIRKNVDFHGSNAWTLVFAIFIASIGLNVNSTAVIIGAMLISPLMGPILGIGLSLGVNDELLLKKSFRNLSIAVLISIITSMTYFLLSPIHDAQSELLARTYPTFYDVLIAFFGGAAGIVSISRKEKGPSVAGVAIATALMPPLCTAGFALSSGNLKFLAGALYLFVINSVFIALSTLIFVRYMKFKVVQYQDKVEKKKIRGWISLVVISIILPSLFFAWSLLQESNFNLKADKFIKAEISSPTSFVVGKNLQFKYKEPVIEVSLIGPPLSSEKIKDLKSRLPFYLLEGADLKIQQIDPLESARNATSTLEVELNSLRQLQQENDMNKELLKNLSNEVTLLFPSSETVVQIGHRWGVIWKKKPQPVEVEKINKFFSLRDKNIQEPPLHLSRLETKVRSQK